MNMLFLIKYGYVNVWLGFLNNIRSNEFKSVKVMFCIFVDI